MSKEITTTKLTLTTEQRESAIKRIQKGLAGVERGYINIAADVAKLADAAAYTEVGYKNIYDMCDVLFGMSRGTVSNLRSIVKRFFDSNYKMLPEYKDFSVTALLAMKDLTDEEIQLLELTPEMSNKELREIIASLNAESAPAIEDSEAESGTDSEAESEADSEEAAPDREPKRLQLFWNSETDADGNKLIKAMQEAKAMNYDFVEVTVL
jgi:hypothetical protein